ncbi:MAG: HEAT repeat domain-containing protein [Chloroflexi bacterium]|nr:MAG: HEAT repeat domain-containing protein [Chloroflexota bacterium]
MIHKALAEWDWHIHRRAAVQLLNTFHEALPQLLDALHSPIAIIRERAAYTLGELGDATAIQALIAMVDDVDAHVRYHVLYALERLKAQDALPIFLHALKHDKDADVRYRAAAGLATLGYVEAVPGLLKALQDHKLHVRHRAIYALGILGDKRAIPDLMLCCQDPSQRIQQAARQALKLLGEEHPTHILHINRDAVDL